MTGSADPMDIQSLMKKTAFSKALQPKDESYFKSDKYRRYLQSKADFYNNSVEGELKHYNCEICKNKGFLMKITEELNEISVPCECLAYRECYKAIEESGIDPEELKRMTFDNFTHREEWQTKLKYTALRYIQDVNNVSGWLFLSGQSGCGKTHLCTAVCDILLHNGYKVKYITWRKLCRDIGTNKYKTDEVDKIMKDITDSDVLYIDDFLKSEKPEKDIAIEVLNARYASRKPTVISTEHDIESLKAIDEAIAGRINEMAKNHKAQVLKKEGRNYRLNKN